MVQAIISLVGAVVVGLLSLCGVIITAKTNANKMQYELDKHNAQIQAELDKHDAIQDTKLEELTREVRQHNEFCLKIPVLEQRVTAIEKKIEKM